MDGYVTITGLLSITSCLVGFYFSSRTARKQDQEAEREKAQNEQKMWDKLDEISRSTSESREKLEEISAEISSLKQDTSEVAFKVKALERRVEKIEDNLAKLHQEHRKRCEDCGN